MIENIINFAKLNPWTMGFTVLSLFVFIIMIFLINGKEEITKDAKLGKKMLNAFMLFIVMIFLLCIIIMGLSPAFAALIDKEDFTLVYWGIVGAIWATVTYVTGVNPKELIDDIIY